MRQTGKTITVRDDNENPTRTTNRRPIRSAPYVEAGFRTSATMSIAPHTALGAILPILYGRVAQYDKLIAASGVGRYAWGSQQFLAAIGIN